jgi:hypothetical protein
MRRRKPESASLGFAVVMRRFAVILVSFASGKADILIRCYLSDAHASFSRSNRGGDQSAAVADEFDRAASGAQTSVEFGKAFPQNRDIVGICRLKLP